MKLDKSRYWTTYQNIGFGIRLYVCYAREFVGPVGLVWGIPLGSKPSVFFVLNSFVLLWARRQKVRTTINKLILEHHEQIQTGSRATKEGDAFMKKSGYVDMPGIGCRILKRKKSKKKKSK